MSSKSLNPTSEEAQDNTFSLPEAVVATNVQEQAPRHLNQLLLIELTLLHSALTLTTTKPCRKRQSQ